MNPLAVAQARTARLVREAQTPVYTTRTPKAQPRPHIAAVEIDGDYGRHWSHMPENEVDDYLARLMPGDGLSDLCHSPRCWCGDDEFVL